MRVWNRRGSIRFGRRRRGAYLSGMLLFAMGFVSGAVFPASVLPGWVQPIGAVVPTRFAFDRATVHPVRGGVTRLATSSR